MRFATQVLLLAVLAFTVLSLLSAMLHARETPSETLVDALERERVVLKAELKELRARRARAARAAEQRLAELRQQVDRERERYESAWARVLSHEREMRELDARLETTPVAEEGSPNPLGQLQRELSLESPDEQSDAERL